MSNSLDILQNTVRKIRPSVILLQEIWQATQLPQFKGFQKCESLLRKHSRGGGVAYWVADNLEYEVVNLSHLHEESLFEILALRIDKYLIANYYRVPNTPIIVFTSALKAICHYAVTNKLVPIICGDSNINTGTVNTKANALLQTVNALGLKQIVNNTTRPIASGESNIIDHCIISQTLKTRHKIIENLASDHFGVSFSFKENIRFIPEARKKIYTYNTENISRISKDLEDYDWISWGNKNSEEMATELCNFLHTTVEKHCSKIIKIKEKSDFFTPSLSLKKLGKKCRLLNRNRNNNAWEKLLILRKKYKKTFRKEKSAFFLNKFSDCNGTKQTWQLIKEITNTKKDPISFPKKIEHEGNIFTSDKTISTEFNKFFQTIASKLESKLPAPTDSPLPKQVNTVLNISHITNSDTLTAINSLKSKKSFSTDLVSNQLIKNLKWQLIPILTELFNKCLEEHNYPSSFKLAKILPLYKKDKKHLFTNYRPISLLSSISKVFEKIIGKFIYNYFETHKYFNKKQFGFRSSMSTGDALLEFASEWHKRRNNANKYYASIYIDLSKAFDTISTKILLKKLGKYGMDVGTIKLIKSYLSDRKQFVQTNCKSDTLNSMPLGVPQGSVLGPLLFLIYINDFSPDCIYTLFADDTHLHLEASSKENLLRKIDSQLKYCWNFFLNNRLSFNIKKTVYLTNIKEGLNIKLNNINIERIQPGNNFKFLGLELATYPNITAHYNLIYKKIMSGIGALNRLKARSTVDIRRIVYFALIESHLNYALLSWGSKLNHDQLNKLVALQKKAVRLIYNLKYNAHTATYFKKGNILRLNDLLQYQQIITIHKLITPNFKTSKISRREGNLRNQHTITSNVYPFHEACKSYNRAVEKGLFDNYKLKHRGTIISKKPSLAIIKKRLKTDFLSTYQTNCNPRTCYVCQSQTNT